MARILAAADIGSNTAHILIAEAQRSGLKRLVNESDWLSLGEIVGREGRIPDTLAIRLQETLKRFKRLAQSFRSEQLYVFATEAMRRAENCEEILAQIKKTTGLKVDLISPLREAELGLRGALEDTNPHGTTLMVETGGGSVQAAWVKEAAMQKSLSMRIGSGSLIAASGLLQPASHAQIQRVAKLISDELSGLDAHDQPSHIISCGGVARGIWRALHPDGDRRMHLEELRFLAWDAARLTPAQIVARYGVKAKRAATLLPGALVYSAFLEKFGLEEMEVSQFGVREGALLEMADGGVVACQV